MEDTSSEFIEVRYSKIHHKGIFAGRDIPKGTKIIEYVGEKITKKESNKRADEVIEASKSSSEKGAVYIFKLNRWYDIDGNVSWNTARFINHSCNPNCEATSENDEIWIVATRDILKGEELSYNYGYDFDEYQDHPCKCGAEQCVGYILDEKYWKRLTAKKI